jgi:drug/metabolite transporter (DMT)-like permease
MPATVPPPSAAAEADAKPTDPTDAPPPPRNGPDEPTRQRAALLLSFGLILVWGGNFTVQKHLFAELTPLGFLFARYLIMPVCATLLLWQRYGWHWPRLPKREWWALLRLGLLGHSLHIGLVVFGIHWSTAFSSALILACGPIFTLLLLRWAGTEALTRAQIAGVAVAFFGVLVFLSDKLLGGRWEAGGGDLILLVAAACFAGYTVQAKPMIERHGGVVVMTYATLLGSAPLLLVSLPTGVQIRWAELPVTVWGGLGYAVVLSAFVGWLVWGWVNAVRGIARTAPLMYLMPPVAGLVAWAVTGERYTAIKLAGAVVTLLGVALAQFASRPRREEPLQGVAVVD